MNEETEQLLKELERIVVERQDWLFRFAYMRIGVREDAEDLIQEVLLRVFRRLREKTQIDSVEQYLILSISNACKDYFRRKTPKVVMLDKAKEVAISDGDRQIAFLLPDREVRNHTVDNSYSHSLGREPTIVRSVIQTDCVRSPCQLR